MGAGIGGRAGKIEDESDSRSRATAQHVEGSVVINVDIDVEWAVVVTGNVAFEVFDAFAAKHGERGVDGSEDIHGGVRGVGLVGALQWGEGYDKGWRTSGQNTYS